MQLKHDISWREQTLCIGAFTLSCLGAKLLQSGVILPKQLKLFVLYKYRD